MMAGTIRSAARRESNAALDMMEEVDGLFAKQDLDEESVLFLLDGAQGAISRCRSMMEKFAEEREKEEAGDD